MNENDVADLKWVFKVDKNSSVRLFDLIKYKSNGVFFLEEGHNS